MASVPAHGEDWLQFKFDSRNSGNAGDHRLQPASLGLVGAVPLTDGVYASPVVADGRIYAVDGSGVVFCIDAEILETVWRVETRGGLENCNNISSPAIIGEYLHVGTTAGIYYVIDRATGEIVNEVDCLDPIFSAAAVGNERAYFVTLGAQVYAGEAGWGGRLDLGLRRGVARLSREPLEWRRMACSP